MSTILMDLSKKKANRRITGIKRKVKVVGMDQYYAELYNELSAQESADKFTTMAKRHRYGDIRVLLNSKGV